MYNFHDLHDYGQSVLSALRHSKYIQYQEFVTILKTRVCN